MPRPSTLARRLARPLALAALGAALFPAAAGAAPLAGAVLPEAAPLHRVQDKRLLDPDYQGRPGVYHGGPGQAAPPRGEVAPRGEGAPRGGVQGRGPEADRGRAEGGRGGFDRDGDRRGEARGGDQRGGDGRGFDRGDDRRGEARGGERRRGDRDGDEGGRRRDRGRD